MDVLFVDVGFGTCNIILTGSGEAIVIDAGERSETPLAILNHYSVKRISHLIVSHWHDDHVGGATGVLRKYSPDIGHIWFPFDSAETFKDTDFWSALEDELAAGNIQDHQASPLLVNGAKPNTIWQSAALDADLSVVSPCFVEAKRGVASGDSNATSGVMLLRAGMRHIVFAGDAVLTQWEGVRKRVPTPIEAEVLAVPHHAGIMWPKHWKAAQIHAALTTLYTKVVNPKVAIVSASTTPGIKHPREDVVDALVKVKAEIMCTQMTSRCTSDLEKVRKDSVSLPLIKLSRSSEILERTKRTKKSSQVACAGTVIVEFLASGTKINHLPSHQAMVKKIPNNAGVLPICQR